MITFVSDNDKTLKERKDWLTLTGGARGVMVIIVGNTYGDTSSNPGRDWLHFT